VDDLKGFPEAIETVFLKTLVQICIVHQIRNSLNLVSYKDLKEGAADLKPIYTAATAEEAVFQLEVFAEKWDKKYPLIAKSRRNNWSRIEPMFQFPSEIQRAIYTTNVIESLNMSLRKITKTRAAFPSEEAAFKLLRLGLQNIEKKWTMPIRHWRLALQQFVIFFDGRLPLSGLYGN
jgi:putative transposase